MLSDKARDDFSWLDVLDSQWLTEAQIHQVLTLYIAVGVQSFRRDKSRSYSGSLLNVLERFSMNKRAVAQ